jgi:hypothetical protein
MGQRGGCRKQEVRKHNDGEKLFHGQLPNIGLPEAMVLIARELPWISNVR